MQVLKPASAVLKLLNPVDRGSTGPFTLRNMVGVHVRSRPVQDDNAAADCECEDSVDMTAGTDHWRSMSTATQFVPEMIRVRRN